MKPVEPTPTPKSTEEAEVTTPAASEELPNRVFDPAKAGSDFKLVADWLSRRSTTEKLCLWAGLVLMDGDTQWAIKRKECYRGNIGDDLFFTLDRELCSLAAQQSPNTTLDAESQRVLAYVAGLETGRA